MCSVARVCSLTRMCSLQVCHHSKEAHGLSRAPDVVGGIHTLLEWDRGFTAVFPQGGTTKN